MRLVWLFFGWAVQSPGAVRAAEGDSYPLAVAGGGGKLFIADRGNATVWLLEGKEVKPHFQGSPKFRTPLNAVRCLTVAPDGSLMAGDSSTREVYRFDALAKPIGVTGGKIGIPMDIAVAANGDLFVADLELHTVFRVDAKSGTTEVHVKVPAPRGVAIDSQNRLWVVSHGKSPLLRVLPDKSIEKVVEDPVFQFAHQVRVHANGDAFVSDGYGKCVWRIPASGSPSKLDSGDKLINPVGLHIEGNSLWIADPRASAIFRWDLTQPTKDSLEVVHRFGER